MASDVQLREWLNFPVLLYGPRKSGTTLLLNLLDGSPELLAFPTETKFKYFVGHWPTGAAARRRYFEQSITTRKQYAGLNSAAFNDGAANAVGYPMSSIRELIQYEANLIYDCLEDKSARLRMFAMKDVGGHTELITGLFRQCFLDGKIVMIARQPQFVARSVFRNRRRRGVRLSFVDKMRQAFDPERIIDRQYRIIESDRSVHLLFYEDLVSETEQVMKGVSAYLGLEYDEVFSRPTIFGEDVVVSTSSQATQDVFVDTASWTADLTLSERCAIFFVPLVKAVWRRLSGRRLHSYDDLRRLCQQRCAENP